jgi:tetratricopeptide (TPR) repeat protein
MTTDPDAFNLYLKGRYEWHRRTEESLHAAADYFAQAVERAPDYARGHAGLADAHAVLGFYDFIPPRDAFPAAAAAARRALELQPSLGEPHATLGYVALYYDWDWPRAEREFRRSIELEPAYSTGHQWYANYLTAMGRFSEAIAEMRAAMELDPLSVIANAALGFVLYYAGENDRAIAQCTRALELDPRFALAHLWRAQAYEARGDVDSALSDFEQAVRLSGGSAIHIALQARALAGAGRPDDARALLQQLEQRDGADYVPPFEMAKLHEALGDVDAALSALERAYDHRSHSMAFLAVDSQLRRLHDEPRFRDLIERVGLDGTPGGRRLK